MVSGNDVAPAAQAASRDEMQVDGTDNKGNEADSSHSISRDCQKRPNYKLKFQLEGHEKAVAAVKFSNCGRYLASASAGM
jgi:WD40 repeat protein